MLRKTQTAVSFIFLSAVIAQTLLPACGKNLSLLTPPKNGSPQSGVSNQPNPTATTPTPTSAPQGAGAGNEGPSFNLCENFPFEKLTVVEGTWKNSGKFNRCSISGSYEFKTDKFKFNETTGK